MNEALYVLKYITCMKYHILYHACYLNIEYGNIILSFFLNNGNVSFNNLNIIKNSQQNAPEYNSRHETRVRDHVAKL